MTGNKKATICTGIFLIILIFISFIPKDNWKKVFGLNLSRFATVFSTSTDFTTWYVSPSNGPTPGFSTMSVDVDSKGNIYVGDSLNQRIVVLNPDGSASTTYDGGSLAPLGNILGISVSSDGHIYATDVTSNKVNILNPDGSALTSVSVPNPYGVFVDNVTGYVYVASYLSKVYVLNPDGTASTTYTIPAPGVGAVAVSHTNNKIYVSSGIGNGGKITVLNFDGSLIGSNFLNPPYGIGDGAANVKVGPNGDVYVAEQQFKKIRVMYPNGSTTKDIYYGDSFNPFYPRGLAVSNSGQIYIGGNSNRIYVLNPDGTASTTYNNQIPGRLINPQGITIDSLGNVYVADNSVNSIQKFDSAGNFIKFFNTGPLGFHNLKYLAVDSSNNIYATDANYYHNLIVKFDSNGNVLKKSSVVQTPSGITVDKNGYVYVTGIGNEDLTKFDSNLNVITSKTFPYDPLTYNSFSSGGLSSDPSGNFLYVAFGSNNSQLVKFNTSDLSVVSATSGPVEAPFSNLQDVRVDTAGNIYLSDSDGYQTANSTIIELAPDFSFIAKWGGAYGSADGQFNYPQQIAINSLGRVFVADSVNARIQRTGPKVTVQDNIIGDTWAILYGLIDESTTNLTEIGFHYGLFPGPVNQTISTTTNLSIGIYDLKINNLTCGTTYSYNAYVVNNSGEGAGTVQTFTTLPCSSTLAICHYDTPAQNCVYNEGPSYDLNTNCGLVLSCSPDENQSSSTDSTSSTTSSTSTEDSTGSSTPDNNGTSTPVLTIISTTISPIANTVNEVFSKVTDTTNKTLEKISDEVNNAVDFVAYQIPILAPAIKVVNEFLSKDSVSNITKIIATAGVIAIIPLAVNPLEGAFSLADVWMLPTRLFGLLLGALGIKKKSRPWGTVYDSVTKRPLDPAYVSLIDKKTGKEMASAITDLDGRYGFLVLPGKYIILAKKTNYEFPSKKMLGKNFDDVYNDLYFGSEITIDKEEDIITKNIPMDPLKFDWNEFTKNRMNVNTFVKGTDLFIAKASETLFVAGGIVSVTTLIFLPEPYNVIIFGCYILAYLLNYFVISKKKPGTIRDKNTQIPLAYAMVKIFSQDIEGDPIAKKVADKNGKYFSLVPKGYYYLQIEKKNDDGSYTQVHKTHVYDISNGVMNKKVEI